MLLPPKTFAKAVERPRLSASSFLSPSLSNLFDDSDRKTFQEDAISNRCGEFQEFFYGQHSGDQKYLPLFALGMRSWIEYMWRNTVHLGWIVRCIDRFIEKSVKKIER